METKIVDNSPVQRFEIYLDGDLVGSSQYHLHANEIAFLQTEVYPEFQGRGLASTLARYALDDARESHRTVLPYCSFIHGWISHHPDYIDLVPEAKRRQFDL